MRAGRLMSVVLVLGLVLAPMAAGSAAVRAPAVLPADPQDKLDELEKRVDKLTKEYRGEIINLSESKKDAKRASDFYRRLSEDAEQAREKVGRLAAASYMNLGFGPLPTSFGGDPQSVMDSMAAASYLARDNGMKVKDLRSILARAERARRTAAEKVDEVEKLVEDLERDLDKVRKLLVKYKPQAAKKPDKAPKGKSPLIGNYMTPRMRQVFVEIDAKFGPFPAIGCYRAGDPLDHGSGRACDFMESGGGSMPSAGALAHGDQVAQYAISNARRLGIKYIIWKQRIWDIRTGAGWRSMSDRGGVTANHFDHNHISVL